jgi:hypothetical protein
VLVLSNEKRNVAGVVLLIERVGFPTQEVPDDGNELLDAVVFVLRFLDYGDATALIGRFVDASERFVAPSFL